MACISTRSPGASRSLAAPIWIRSRKGWRLASSPGKGSGATITRQPRSTESMSRTRPVTVTGPRRRWSVGACALPTCLADQGKAGTKHCQGKRSLTQQRAFLQQPRANPGGKGGAKAKPQRRLKGQREIDADAPTKAYRQPQQPALAFSGIVFGDRLELPRAPCRGCAEPTARYRRIRHCCPAIRDVK